MNRFNRHNEEELNNKARKGATYVRIRNMERERGGREKREEKYKPQKWYF
jgi:hypothetical protein